MVNTSYLNIIVLSTFLDWPWWKWTYLNIKLCHKWRHALSIPPYPIKQNTMSNYWSELVGLFQNIILVYWRLRCKNNQRSSKVNLCPTEYLLFRQHWALCCVICTHWFLCHLSLLTLTMLWVPWGNEIVFEYRMSSPERLKLKPNWCLKSDSSVKWVLQIMNLRCLSTMGVWLVNCINVRNVFRCSQLSNNKIIIIIY